MQKSSAAVELTLANARLPVERQDRRKEGTETTVRDYWRFLSGFVRHPRMVGAIAPSSRRLAATMMPPGEVNGMKIVVELGAGTGAITGALRRRIGGHARLIALELHGPSAGRLQRRFRDVAVVGDSAERLRHHLDRLGHRYADCIVSGLPWGSMSGDLQRRILDSVLASLRPGGTFSAMAYLHARRFPSARNFRLELERRFRHVTLSPVVWANLPPAFVYYCR